MIGLFTPSVDREFTAGERRAGMRNAYLSQLLGTHLNLFLGYSAVTPLFVKALGGSDFQAMLPGAFLSLTTCAQIPIALFARPRDIRQVLVRCWAGSSAVMVAGLALVMARTGGSATVWLLLAAVFASQLLQQSGGTFWFPLLHDVVPAERRGRFFGRLRSLWHSAYLLLGVLAGLFLGSQPPLWKFAAVLGAAAALQFMREPFVARIPHRRREPEPVNWRGDLAGLQRHRALLIFFGYILLLMFLAGFIGQPTVLYMRQLGYTTGHNAVVYALSSAGNVTALLVAGWLLDRVGTKRVFRGVHLALCALAGLLVLAGELPHGLTRWLLPLLTMASGAALACANLANTAQIFHFAPERGKPIYMSVGNVVTLLGGAISPLCAGALLDSPLGPRTLALGPLTLSSLQVLFLLAAAGLLLAMALLRYLPDVHPGRAAGAADAAQD